MKKYNPKLVRNFLHKITHKTTWLTLILILTLSLFLSQAEAGGIGVSPTEITVYDAMRGGRYQKLIKIFNTIESPTTFLLNATGEIDEWVSFYIDENLTETVTNVTLASNSNQLIYVILQVPNEAPNGNYTGKIYVQTLPKKMEGQTGTSVIISASLGVFIEVVGTQILGGNVRGISTIDTEVGYPLRIKVEFENTGNVEAEPEIRIVVFRDETEIDSFTYSKTQVKPGLRDIISVEWNTTGRDPGDYSAKVTVLLEGKVLEERQLQFKILPFGTLTRRGQLTALSVEGKPLVGTVLRIHATFRNTGLIDTTAHFVGEIYRDGDLIDVIESPDVLVEVGTEKNITSYLKLTQEGTYMIKGYVFYEGKQTDVKELVIQVKVKQNTTDENNLLVAGFMVIAIGTAIPLLLLTRKRKRKTKRRSKR